MGKNDGRQFLAGYCEFSVNDPPNAKTGSHPTNMGCSSMWEDDLSPCLKAENNQAVDLHGPSGHPGCCCY